MAEIVKAHFPELEESLHQGALDAFCGVRNLPGLSKKPATSELLDWSMALRLGGIPEETLTEKIPFAGILLKKTEDLGTLEKRYVY